MLKNNVAYRQNDVSDPYSRNNSDGNNDKR